ncbi:MAG: hypothetical protein JZU65_11330 [Chlorobium sp.]|nr:hypothetical protein [Chlorobium sp.]
MNNINVDSEVEAECEGVLNSYLKLVDTRIRRSQISILSPYESKLESGSVSSSNINTEHYKQMVFENRPFSFFATLTFHRSVRFSMIVQYSTTLIHRFANLEFGRNYDDPDCITGFAFFEKHSDNPRSNDNHLHLLIKHHDKYDESDFVKHLAKFHKASSKIVDGNGRPIFNENCIDFQEVSYDDGAIDYCFKELWDRNLSRLKFIGVDGLSDNEDDRFN